MTEAVSDLVDIKVHYNYNGVPRCTLIDGTFSKLYEMDYTHFIAYLLEEIPQLTRLDPVKRLSFLDDEGTYIDLTSRNFHRFLRLSCAFKSDVPKINIKIYEGASPAPKLTRRNDDDNNNKSSKKSLVLDYEEFSKVPYKSPLELDMDLKRRELTVKETELQLVQSEYKQLWKKYNPVMYNDSSRSLCNRCHLRMGHNKNRCHMTECESAMQCGLVEKHPEEKKELQELGKKKQKLEGELKSLKFDIKTKERATNEVSSSFEAKVHDVLIRTNPEKYLTDQSRPKEGVILADSYILKKYYGGKQATKEMMEQDSVMYQTIIESYKDKMKANTPKNSVAKELDMSSYSPRPQSYFPTGSPYGGGYTWQMMPFILPPFDPNTTGLANQFQGGPMRTTPPPVATPPPPAEPQPPLPQEDP